MPLRYASLDEYLKNRKEKSVRSFRILTPKFVLWSSIPLLLLCAVVVFLSLVLFGRYEPFVTLVAVIIAILSFLWKVWQGCVNVGTVYSIEDADDETYLALGDIFIPVHLSGNGVFFREHISDKSTLIALSEQVSYRRISLEEWVEMRNA